MDVESNTTHTTRPVIDPEPGWAPPRGSRGPAMVTAVDTTPGDQTRSLPVDPYRNVDVQHVDLARTVTRAEITPAAIAAGVVSLGLLVIGGITSARAGFDRPLDQPVVEVAGFTATAVLGIIELALGVVFLACAVTRSRQATLFIAALALAGSLVAYFQPDVGNGSLGIERSGAAVAVAAMAVVVAVSLLPAIRRTSTSVSQR